MLTTRVWLDKDNRNWVGQVLDHQGNQIGDAEFAATRGEVEQALRYRKMVEMTHLILGGPRA